MTLMVTDSHPVGTQEATLESTLRPSSLGIALVFATQDLLAFQCFSMFLGAFLYGNSGCHCFDMLRCCARRCHTVGGDSFR